MDNINSENSVMSMVDRMLTSTIGETDSDLRITFKKTVKTREYETEVMEVTQEMHLDKETTGMERVFISQLLKCQAEYATYIDLFTDGIVTKDEYIVKRKNISEKLYSMIEIAKRVGIDVEKYLGEQK